MRENYLQTIMLIISQVPYHDARVTTPGPKERVLHYMAPPNQVKHPGVLISDPVWDSLA